MKPTRRVAVRRLMAARNAQHPRLGEAVRGDVDFVCRQRGERSDRSSRLAVAVQAARLAWVSDAFLAQLLYRVRTRLLARGVPVLPQILHGACVAIAQVCIDEPVIIAPGLCLTHGQVVIAGLTEIGPRTSIAPWTSIGLVAGDIRGPTIGADVRIGTGARLLGPLEIGSRGTDRRQRRGDRPASPTGPPLVGVPARVVR